MKVPPIFAQFRLIPFALIAALSIGATVAIPESPAEPKLGAESELETESLVDAAELEAQRIQNAKLERNFETKLAAQLETLTEQALDASVTSLAAAYDAHIRQRTQLNARIDFQLAGLGLTPGSEYDAPADDRSWTIRITSIPTPAPPGAPAI